MNFMRVSVAERSPGIGVGVVVGADQAHVLTQFLAEAGAVLGGALGAGTALALASALDWSMQADVGICLGSLTFSARVGLASGLQPAFTASLLDPMKAIRQ